MSRLVTTALVVTAGILWFATGAVGIGRRFWYPAYQALVGPRTHSDVLEQIGPGRRPELERAANSLGLHYPPSELTLVGLKDQKLLEVWARSPGGWVLFRTYPVLAASGGPGPKLREGDRQVPEGIYRLTGFNPNSSYHLSIRVDYPSSADLEAAEIDGRSALGGDIFIHGKAVSIGCLAIGDSGIEELYVLLADVGLARSRILLTPSGSPVVNDGAPGWLATRYLQLQTELQDVRAATAGTVGFQQ